MPRVLGTVLTAAIFALTIAATAHAGPVDKAKGAVDPNCTPGKAVKGAAQRATVGVGNRCKAGETARDTLGVDDKRKKDDKRRRGRAAEEAQQ